MKNTGKCNRAYGKGIVALIVLLTTLALIALVLLSYSIVGDNPNEGNPKLADNKRNQQEMGLQVVQVSPMGVLPYEERFQEMVVVFNQAMIPLGRLETETTGAFSIKPAIKGQFRWYGSKVCAFNPEDGWMPDQEYTITISQLEASLQKKKLSEDYQFTLLIKPQLFQLQSIYPDIEQRINNTTEFSLHFSQGVEISAIEKYVDIAVNDISGKTKFNFKAVHPQITAMAIDDPARDDKRYKKLVHITNLTPFPKDSEVIITIDSDLSPIDSNTKLQKKQIMSFYTYGPLKAEINEYKQPYFSRWNYNFRFNNPVDMQTAMQAIQFSPSAAILSMEKIISKEINFSNWRIEPGLNYQITIKPFNDVNGNSLARDYSFKVTMPDLAPDFGFDLYEKYYTIESEQDQKLPINISSLPSLDVSLVGLELSDLLLLQQNRGLDLFVAKQSSEVFWSKTWQTGVSVNESRQAGLELAPYLNKNKTGWLGVRLQGIEADWQGKTRKINLTRYIQSTDIGLTIKEDFKRVYSWTHSLQTAEKLDGVLVEVYQQNSFLGKCLTNGDGFCVIEKAESTHLKNAVYHASFQKQDQDANANQDSQDRIGHDSAFVTSNDHQVYMYSLSPNFSRQAAQSKLLGGLYFDRRLYRPGDKMSYKAVMSYRRESNLVPATKEYFEVIINNSQGEKIYQSKEKSSSQGGLWGDFDIDKDASLGHYTIMVKSAKSSQLIMDTFQVEEFRPVNFSVDIDIPKSAKIGDKLDILLKAKYLFGAPMQGADLAYAVSRQQSSVFFEHLPGFYFGDHDFISPDYNDSIDTGYHFGGSLKLDMLGKANLPVTVDAMKVSETFANSDKDYTMSHSYQMLIEARVTGPDDKSVTKQARMSVRPGEFLIGIKAGEYYQSSSKEFSFSVVTTDFNGANVSGRKLTYRITRKSWQSIQSQGPGESVQNRNSLQRDLVYSGSLKGSAEPAIIVYRVSEPGEYLLTVQDSESEAFSRIGFYAYGQEQASWDYSDDDSLSLISDKEYYLPGDEAQVLVKTPFDQGMAIVSLEREAVLWHKTIPVSDFKKPLVVPIKEEYLPNVYLSVLLIKPRVDASPNLSEIAKKDFYLNDYGRPQFKVGIVNLAVSNQSRSLPLQIQLIKKTYGPGDRVIVKFISEPGAEIVLTVADRGVLDLIDYRYADPINKMYGDWPHGVAIYENRKQIVKQFRAAVKGSNPGGAGSGVGDEGRGGFSHDSESGSRRNFRHTAYWRADIIADAQGHAEVDFNLPDNLTTFRLMAVAAANAKYGKAIDEIKVRKALVLQPIMPRFMRLEDTLEMGALVTNQTGQDAKFIISIESNLLKMAPQSLWQRWLTKQSKKIEIELGNNQSSEVAWTMNLDIEGFLRERKNIEKKRQTPLQEKEEQGGSLEKLVYLDLVAKPIDQKSFVGSGLSTQDIQDALRVYLPIVEEKPSEAFAIAGYTEGRAEEAFTIPPREQLLSASLNFSAANSALLGLENAFHFYESNPYFCLEQRTSAFLLAMTSGRMLSQFRVAKPKKDSYDFNQIEKLFLGDLQKFQNADGGMRPWLNVEQGSNPYLTSYVMIIMQFAKENGYSINEVNQGVYGRMQKYLQNTISHLPKDEQENLYENLSLVPAMSNVRDLLIEKRSQLSLRGRAYLAIAIAKSQEIKHFQQHPIVKEIVEDFMSQMVVTTRKVSIKQKPSKDSSVNENSANGGGSYYMTEGSTLGAVLRALVMLYPEHPFVEKIVQYAIAQGSGSLWRDSHSVGQLAWALWDYYQKFEAKDSFLGKKIEITLNNQLVSKHRFSKGKLQLHQMQLDLDQLYIYGGQGKTVPLIFSNSDPGSRIYYSASFEYAPSGIQNEPRDEGFEIHRRLFAFGAEKQSKAAGRKIVAVDGDLERGKIYLCRLIVINPKPYFNMVIDSPIAANLEIVNASFATEGSIGSLVEMDEEEYWWQDSQRFQENRLDRFILSQQYLHPGLHQYEFLVRPLVKGEAMQPASQIKLMYEPEIFGRSDSVQQRVR